MKNDTIKNWRPTVVATIVGLVFLASNAPLLAETEIKKINIIEDGISIDGKKLGRNSTLADYEKILGKADRVARLMNSIYTFDDLGIYLYQKKNKEAISDIVIMFKAKPSMKFQPKKPFQAVLTISSKKLGYDFSQASIKGLTGVIPDGQIGKYSSTATSFGTNLRLLFDHRTNVAKLDSLAISWK